MEKLILNKLTKRQKRIRDLSPGSLEYFSNSNLDSAIGILKSMLDNNSFNETLFYRVLHSFERIPFVPFFLNPVNKIIRSSSNTDGAFHGNVGRLNYPPKKEYAKLARANMDGQQMFYASVFNTFEDKDKEYALPPRVISAFETSHLFSDYNQSGKMFTTQSLWKSSRFLHLLMLPNSIVWKHPSKELKMILDLFNKNELYLNGFTEEERKFGLFLGNLFAMNKYSCLYEITSRITDFLLFKSEFSKEFDGIAYPSTKAEGNGFNICLKPSVVDDCVSFEKATVTMIIKEQANVTMFQIADSVLFPGGELKWKPTETAIQLLIENYGPDVLLDPRIIVRHHNEHEIDSD